MLFLLSSAVCRVVLHLMVLKLDPEAGYSISNTQSDQKAAIVFPAQSNMEARFKDWKTVLNHFIIGAMNDWRWIFRQSQLKLQRLTVPPAPLKAFMSHNMNHIG